MIKRRSPFLVKDGSIALLDGKKAYSELRRKVKEAGILDRSYRYYAFLTAFALAGFLFCAYQLVVASVLPLIVVWGVLFTVLAVQIGGLMHDAGHRAIAKSPRMNDWLGRLYSVFIALSYSNWAFRHNLHHARTNQEGDPDVDIPLLSFTREKLLQKSGLEAALVRYQAFLFYPLLSLGGFAQRGGDFKYLMHEKLPKGFYWESIVFVLGLMAWYGAPFMIFDLPKALAVFIVVNFTSGFYMSNIFAPNHKGMPQLSKDANISFMEQQIMTSRNVAGNWLLDFLYIGLNYQIEHHLFPNCPRNKLKLITPYVVEICQRMQLEYTRVSLWESNRAILAELHRMGAGISDRTSPPVAEA